MQITMAVREFTDAGGREWRAWDIKPEDIRPVTKGEDFLADCYVTGWVVFETAAGDEKRRLCPWPIQWMNETERGLRALLARAEVVPPQRVRAERKSGAHSLPAPASEADVTDLEVVRTFRYPKGRYWTVCVVSHPEDGGLPVLRFTAGLRHLDFRDWPKDWPDQPDDVLVAMLRRAAPRRETAAPAPNTPRRRWDDRPETSYSA
jgi:hypothetical protein